MRTFEMAQNASITFRVGSSYKEGLNPTCVLSKWPKMQVLIAFRVGSLYKEGLNPTCVLSKWPKMKVLHLG
jgi:hypothetical protein